ncbi:MAG TPA: DUF2242 domain-containing protein [Burkholderiales bacterium]|nr:DUF2242 domain-containing protein [Burkholderiales bacterium]
MLQFAYRIPAIAFAVLLAGCASRGAMEEQAFSPKTQFSKKIRGSGEVVCWSVKRAFLSQGYMLDRTADPVIVTGVKDLQPDEDTQESLRLQATCVDNRDGTSTVFATAAHEVSKLQRSPQSVSAGVSIATITLPAGTDKRLALQRRETVHDPQFYERFYALVQEFAREEAASARSSSASRGASARSD